VPSACGSGVPWSVSELSCTVRIGEFGIQAVYVDSSSGSSGETSQEARPTRRNIPLPIQREVRQRCGFGCVFCGLPLYEYDHLLGWENVQRHVAEEITLLCDSHHRERTNGLLPLEQVTEADANPYNRQTGVSKPYDLHFAGDSCEVVVGGNSFTMEALGSENVLVPISIDEVWLLHFVLMQEHLLLNLIWFDELNEPVLEIENNQLVYSVSPWDIRLVGRRLEIREAARRFLVDIQFEPPDRVVVERGRFLLNGVELLVHPDYLLLTNNGTVLRGGRVINVPRGVVVGSDRIPAGAAIRIQGVNRYQFDRTEALQWVRECFEEETPESG
jgi:hypothetical protein